MTLETLVKPTRPETAATPLLALPLTEGGLPDSLAGLDGALGGALGRLLATGDFAGKRDQTALLYPGGKQARVLLIGLGPAAELDVNGLRRAAAIATKRARQLGVPEAALYLAAESRGALGPEQAGRALAEGLPYGAWHYDELKQPAEDKKPPLARVTILAPADTKAIQRGHDQGAAIGAGQDFARGLQMLPGNVCTPEYLAGVARDMAKRHGFKATVMDRPALTKEGMRAILAVGQGSAEDPRFIVLEHRGAKGAPVVLVGKGITFDTGGISIKPAQNMEDMKFDMSGAAAVLGAMEAIGRLRAKAHVIALVPSAENMPSGTALKPGDVIKSHLGKHIEIVNTDAEGRLVLADALSYARRFKPACVIDAATLTGAVVIALGHTAAGVMGTDEALVAELQAAGERTGERVWPLPLWDDYRDLIKSDIGDVKNSGGRAAGTITAGWFLREFAEGYPWAHLDIAGTAYSDREDPTRGKGPTGMGVRLFTEFVLGRQG